MRGVFFIFIFFLCENAFASTEELKDIKPPVDFPFNPWPFIFLCAGFAIGFMGFLVYYFLRKFKQKKLLVAAKDPWDIARERLEALKKQDLAAQGNFQEFYVELSDIVRRYMEERFRIRAPEMTTQEFLWSLNNSSQLTNEHKLSLKDFLFSCDMVKFARYDPTSREAEESFDLACRLVQETKGVKED